MMAMTTTPTLSEPLRVPFSPEQTLHNSYGVTQSRLGRLTFSRRFDYRETRELANWMILFNSGESPESANPLIIAKTCVAVVRKHEQYSPSFKPENHSGSAEHKHYLGSLVIHCGCTYENQQPTGKEKGSTANAALWDACSSIHEENQSPKNFGDSQPSFRGAVHYESSVVHISTYTKSVGQSSGASLAFSTSSLDSQASNTQEVKLTPGSRPLSTSTHWSMSLTNSCGKRIPLYTVLLFIWPFAMFSLHLCLNTIKTTTKLAFTKVFKQIMLTCLNTIDNLFKHIEGVSQCQNINAPEWWNTAEAPIHNVTKAYTMEYSHSTQTRPEKKYLWRFLALNRSDMCAKPCRISVEAPTEHDARRVLAPFFILSLSARLSAQGVCNV